MKRIGIGLLVALVSCTGLSANMFRTCWGEPCCDPCPIVCGGNIEGGGQWLYLRPSSCDHDFVIRDNRPVMVPPQTITEVTELLPSGCAHGVNPNYESGFRVFLGYLCDCKDVRVEYTYHHPTQSFEVFGSESIGLWPTYMHPRYARNIQAGGGPAFETPIFTANGIQAAARATLRLDYDAVDLQFGSRSIARCNLFVRTYAGLHYMNLDLRHEAQFNGTGAGPGTTLVAEQIVGTQVAFDTHVRWNKNTWGVGPLFGVDLRYPVWCGFGLGARVGAALLAGKTEGTFRERDTRVWELAISPDVDEEATVCHDSRHILFPYVRAGLGVNYLWCCPCLRLLVEVGYEFNSYINTIGHFRFNDERGTGQANCYSYNLDGIYVGIRATI